MRQELAAAGRHNLVDSDALPQVDESYMSNQS